MLPVLGGRPAGPAFRPAIRPAPHGAAGPRRRPPPGTPAVPSLPGGSACRRRPGPAGGGRGDAGTDPRRDRRAARRHRPGHGREGPGTRPHQGAYELARAGQFPCPVIRAGRTWLVPTAGLLAVLGLPVPGPRPGDRAGPRLTGRAQQRVDPPDQRIPRARQPAHQAGVPARQTPTGHGEPDERAGTTFKQCGCRDEGTGKLLGRKCPKLRRGNGWSHGARHLVLPDRAPAARRRHPPRPAAQGRLRHQGPTPAPSWTWPGNCWPSPPPATPRPPSGSPTPSPQPCGTPARCPTPPGSARPSAAASDPAVKPPATGEWLEEWLAAKKKLRPGTVRSYAGHIRLYLKPHLGHIPIDRLRVTDVASVFDHIAGTQRRDHRGPRQPAAPPGGRRSRDAGWSARPPASGSAPPSARRSAPT